MELEGLTPMQDSTNSGSKLLEILKDIRLNQDQKMTTNEVIARRFDFAPNFGGDTDQRATAHHSYFDRASFTEYKSHAMGEGARARDAVAAGNTRNQTADTVPDAHNNAPTSAFPSNLSGGTIVSELMQARQQVVILEKLAMKQAGETAILKAGVQNSLRAPSQQTSPALSDIVSLRRFCIETMQSLMSRRRRSSETRNTRQSASDISSSDI